jgi:hypothetical protein
LLSQLPLEKLPRQKVLGLVLMAELTPICRQGWTT